MIRVLAVYFLRARVDGLELDMTSCVYICVVVTLTFQELRVVDLLSLSLIRSIRYISVNYINIASNREIYTSRT